MYQFYSVTRRYGSQGPGWTYPGAKATGDAMIRDLQNRENILFGRTDGQILQQGQSAGAFVKRRQALFRPGNIACRLQAGGKQ